MSVALWRGAVVQSVTMLASAGFFAPRWLSPQAKCARLLNGIIRSARHPKSCPALPQPQARRCAKHVPRSAAKKTTEELGDGAGTAGSVVSDRGSHRDCGQNRKQGNPNAGPLNMTETGATKTTYCRDLKDALHPSRRELELR